MALSAPWAAMAQSAGDSTWSLTGSYFNLYTQSRTVVPPVRRFILDVGRARLKLVGAPFERVGIEVQYDNEVLLGDYVRTTQYALLKDRVETTFDLQRDYAAGP